MIGVVGGLLGATLIGVSDCVARVTAQRVSMSLLFAAVMGVSTSVLTGWLLVTGDWPRWHAYGWAASAASGFLTLVALFCLYKALARGPVAVASPAASSFAVILIGLNVIAGEPFVGLQGVAGLMVFAGVAMLARRGRRGETFDAAHLRLTAILGLGAAAAVAVRMFLAQEASEILGVLPSLYLNRVFSLVFVGILIAVEVARRMPHRWPDAAMGRLVFIQAMLETLALGAFLFASAGAGRVGATIGFAAFSAVTAITAWIWLGEPIGMRRALWMTLVGAGIALAVAASPVA